MKKILFLFSLLFCVQAYGQTTVDGIRYKFSKTEAQVTSMYPEYSGDIEIPSTITYNGTIYNVTSIGKEAFSECEDLTSVKIPNSVKSIGDYAFFECTNLSSVNIPDSVKVIGNGIFCYCNHLTSITIPEGVTSIGQSAFNSCYRLTSINIPSGVTSIGSYAFDGCTGLTSITTLPDGLMNIGYAVFRECTGLTSITIPKSVTSIGWQAFAIRSLGSIVSLNPNPIPVTNPNEIFSWAYSEVDKSSCILYVPAGSKTTYQEAYEWQDFLNIIELPNFSEENIDVTPSDNNVLIEWQPYENAEGYRLIIYNNEAHTDTVYILEFDSTGKLRSGNTKLSHTIQDLSNSTDYDYTLEILGVGNIVLASQSGEFTTVGEPTSIVETKRTSNEIIGYYNVMGIKLFEEPKSGLYIILYSNGQTEKRIKK